MNKTPYQGVISESLDVRDYQLAAGILNIPTPSNTFDGITYEQDLVSNVSCTIHSAIGAVSDLLGERFTTDFIKKVWEYSKTRGAQEGWGYYVDKAVQDVRRKVNETGKYPELVTFRLVLCSEDFWEAIKLGYSVSTGYRGNQNFNKDFLDDGILDGQDFTNLTYGHAIRITRKDDSSIQMVVDNYPSREHNTYTVKKEVFKKLWENKVFFNSGYIFATRESFVESHLIGVPTWGKDIAEEMKDAGVENKPIRPVGEMPLYELLLAVKKMVKFWNKTN